jgi:DNA-binding MurR/RpiR family transcriptional regulator
MQRTSPLASFDDRSQAIEQLIRSRYEGLSPTDRKLSDIVVERRRDLLAYTATELAQLAGVSKASAARYFKRLGYQDFNDFRAKVRAGLSPESPLSNLESVTRAGDPHPGFASHVAVDARNLAQTLERLNPDDMNRALALLQSARRLWVAGYRNGYATAFYAQALFSHAKLNVALVNEAAANSADILAEVQPGDVLFAIDFRRRTRILSKVIQVARELGATVVLLTYEPLSDLAAQADLVLTCSTEGSAIFDSYVAAMSIVNYLATELVRQAQPGSRKRMQRIEDVHKLLDDLDEPTVLPGRKNVAYALHS